MTKQQLLEELKRCEKLSCADVESAHGNADEALIAFINDPDITAAWHCIDKWYA